MTVNDIAVIAVLAISYLLISYFATVIGRVARTAPTAPAWRRYAAALIGVSPRPRRLPRRRRYDSTPDLELPISTPGRPELSLLSRWLKVFVGRSPGRNSSYSSYIDCDLTGVSLANADLRGFNFTASMLDMANLDGASASGSQFRGTTLRSATLRGSDLRNSDFAGAVLSPINISQLDPLRRRSPENSSSVTFLDDALMDGSKFESADLRYVHGQGCSFYSANLNRANLSMTELSYSRFAGSLMIGATLDRSAIHHSNLVGANLIEASCVEADFTESDLSYADLSHADLTGASARSSVLVGANLSSAILTQASFDDASVVTANLDGVRAENASFQGADLRRASLQRANLTNADLRGTLLQASNLADAVLDGAEIESLGDPRIRLAAARFSLTTKWPFGWDAQEIMYFAEEIDRRLFRVRPLGGTPDRFGIRV